MLRLDRSHAGQLLGQAPLLQFKLIGCAQVLQIAASAYPSMGARLGTPLGAGDQHPLGAGFDDLAARIQHARLDIFPRQSALDKPGAVVEKGNAAAIVGEPLDAQPLLLAGGNLRLLLATTGLEA